MISDVVLLKSVKRHDNVVKACVWMDFAQFAVTSVILIIFLYQMHGNLNISQNRNEVSTCHCSEKFYQHVHCQNCMGRATDRSTEQRHRHWQENNDDWRNRDDFTYTHGLNYGNASFF